jgi:hypothetical protein
MGYVAMQKEARKLNRIKRWNRRKM